MLQQIDRKKNIYIYVFLLFLLSTVNNLSLNNSENFKLKIKSIYVTGLSEEKNSKISEELGELISKNIFFINKSYFKSIIEKNNLIHSFNVKKIYPNSIEIQIEKTELLGIAYYEDEKFFIGSNGKLIKFKSNDKNLPFVYGKINTDNFISLKKIIDKSILNFEEISEIFYFSSGRWDIKTKNEILIKLPNKNLLESINFAIRLIQDETFKNNKVIDLRIANYVISKK